ncbi:MAG: transglycosylase SLT domain-containing protein [Rhodobacterales bacterium]|nr:transglycosylase SLT domain-containing protein [Rhodobacterales bacterium]
MPGRNARQRLVSCALLCALVTPGLQAREDPAGLCLDAAARASARTGVPYEVLLAIAKVESGRNDRPWPWTVNFAGKGQWYETEAAAEAGVAQALDQGATNVDLGCFQLNYRWHAEGFASIADMLDPDRNATYAAKFLAGHFAQTGDWTLAAAAYHSAIPEHATTYQAKFEAALAGLDGKSAEPPPDVPAAERKNGFPLLLAGASGTGGSLVPAGSGGSPLIGAP